MKIRIINNSFANRREYYPNEMLNGQILDVRTVFAGAVRVEWKGRYYLVADKNYIVIEDEVVKNETPRYTIGEVIDKFWDVNLVAFSVKGESEGTIFFVDLDNKNRLTTLHSDGDTATKHRFVVNDISYEDGKEWVFLHEVNDKKIVANLAKTYYGLFGEIERLLSSGRASKNLPVFIKNLEKINETLTSATNNVEE